MEILDPWSPQFVVEKLLVSSTWSQYSLIIASKFEVCRLVGFPGLKYKSLSFQKSSNSVKKFILTIEVFNQLVYVYGIIVDVKFFNIFSTADLFRYIMVWAVSVSLHSFGYVWSPPWDSMNLIKSRIVSPIPVALHTFVLFKFSNIELGTVRAIDSNSALTFPILLL